MSLNQFMYDYGAQKSSIREIAAYASARKAEVGAENVFDFSLGNPSVPAPQQVTDAIRRCLALPPQELHGYTPAPGLSSCRQAVAESLNRRFGTAYSGEHVFMTVGAAASLSCTFRALVNPGDEVVVISPYFPEYKVWIECAGATCIEVPAARPSFQPDLDALAAAVTERTKAVVINSPNNPVGVVYTEESLRGLAQVLKDAEERLGTAIYLVSDEPYREIVYGCDVPWVPSIYDRTVVCYSYSKSLSLPGERVGWVLVPPTNPEGAEVFTAVAGAARALGFVCAPALFQRVIEACVDVPADVAAYAENRDLLTSGLAEAGYTYVEPDGAFYLWVQALEPDCEAFFQRARALELLPVPSTSFGCDGWVRVGYCVARETIERSMPAWRALAQSYR